MNIDLKQPLYEEGSKEISYSDEKMINEEKLREILNSESSQNLMWNNYTEDIGEGRLYQG